MVAKQTSIAIFDFDGTLIKGDSLWPFLGYAAGWQQTLMTMAEAVTHNYIDHWKNPNTSTSNDSRTQIKTYLLEGLLVDTPVEALKPSIEKLYKWLKWNQKIRQALLDHHGKGDHIVIASGGLDLYLPYLLKDTPHDALICTEMQVVNGIITGQMASGNCVRQRKADLVATYLATHGPFADSWGYGNQPHDLSMLKLVNHRTLV